MSRVILKIKSRGRVFFFFLEEKKKIECQPINVDGMIELEKSPYAIPSDLGTNHSQKLTPIL